MKYKYPGAVSAFQICSKCTRMIVARINIVQSDKELNAEERIPLVIDSYRKLGNVIPFTFIEECTECYNKEKPNEIDNL